MATSRMLPPRRPQQPASKTAEQLLAHNIHDAVAIVGTRGYYRDTMGEPGVNDFGIYDDAIFIHSPECHVSFNANTDPARQGFNSNVGKPFAQLKAGVWRYQLGMHKRQYMALIQAEEVKVRRFDGAKVDYSESGWFGINIHKGGWNRVSSEGCQTIYPDQWEAFIALVREQLQRYRQKTLPYVLIDAGGAA